MSLSREDKKLYKPTGTSLMPGQFEALVTAIRARGLSVTLVKEDAEWRRYVVRDAANEFAIDHRTVTNSQGFEEVTFWPIRCSVAFIKTMDDILAEFHRDLPNA